MTEKLSRQEAGRLGSLKSNELSRLQMIEKNKIYLIDPTKCAECNNVLSYKKRRNKFCSQSCASTFNNALKDWDNIQTGPKRKSGNKTVIFPKVTVTWKCLSCAKEHQTRISKVGKYCNLQCQQDYQYKQRIEDWKSNGTFSKGSVKRYFLEKQD